MSRRGTWLGIAALVVAGLVLYARAFSIHRYGDDLGFVLPTPVDPFFHFTSPHPIRGWYRPLEAMLLAFCQNGVGLATWPIHALAIGLHLTLAWMVYAIGRELGLIEAACWLAAGWLLVAQGGVMAVASLDTLSQQLAALGLTAAAWQAHRFLRDGHRSALLFAIVASAVALWGKESGVAVVPVLAVIAAAHGEAGPRRRLATFVTVAVLAVIYWLCRNAIGADGPELGTAAYGFDFGANMPLNAAVLWGACLSPVSTVAMVRWMQLGPAWAYVLATLPTLLLMLGMVAAWRGRRGLFYALAAVAVAAMFPAVLLHHVSELYAYQALPWLALLTGATLAAIPRRWRTGVVASLLLLQVIAVQSKLSAMIANGDRMASYVDQLRPVVASLPRDGTVYLIDDVGGRWRYGVFVLPGFRVFEYALGGLPTVLDRPDLTFVLRGAGQLPEPAPGQAVVILDTDEQRLQVLSQREADHDP